MGCAIKLAAAGVGPVTLAASGDPRRADEVQSCREVSGAPVELMQIDHRARPDL
jgi:hypothetical protein